MGNLNCRKRTMSDAQFDGGDNGQAAEDLVGGFIGERDPEAAVRWYGLFSMATGIGSIFAYMLLNGTWWIANYRKGFVTRMAFYLPVAMGWLATIFFDAPFTREV